jgi:hypothetical protein
VCDVCDVCLSFAEIALSGATVLVSGGAVGEMAMHYIERAGMMVVKVNPKNTKTERKEHRTKKLFVCGTTQSKKKRRYCNNYSELLFYFR